MGLSAAAAVRVILEFHPQRVAHAWYGAAAGSSAVLGRPFGPARWRNRSDAGAAIMGTGFFGLNLNTAAAVAAMATATLVAPAAYGQIFANATPITIPVVGPATPFGSAVNVAGVSDASGIRIRLKGFSHTFCADVAVLLVAPSGIGIELLSRSGGSAGVSGLTLTIAAAGQPFFSETGASGGELRLRGGSHNKADPSPTLGLSNGGDVAIFAGRNFWDAGWHGNIRFHAGFGEPERLRIVGDTGHVGIGTTTPQTLLDVRGSVALGSNGQLRAAAGEVDLRLMYGNVNAGGGIINGTGFAVTNTGTGAYTITFATPFSGPPALTANAVANSSLTVMVTSIAPNAATIQIRNGISVLTSSGFSFTALGPR
ncbi:MAG: hypothetical protein ACK5Z4_09890 [Planctomyces sp.]